MLINYVINIIPKTDMLLFCSAVAIAFIFGILLSNLYLYLNRENDIKSQTLSLFGLILYQMWTDLVEVFGCECLEQAAKRDSRTCTI